MKPSLLIALIVSAGATGVGMWLQQLARETWQIRSLPERVMEWSLLFIPLDVFEEGIRRFGPSAKELAFTGNIVGMMLTLVIVGMVALRTVESGWGYLFLGFALWLTAMAVVMPITGGGLFGSALFQPLPLVNVAFLAVFLGYATTLLCGLALWHTLVAGHEAGISARAGLGVPRHLLVQGAASRRWFVGGLAATLGAWFGATWFARSGVVLISDLPLAVAPPTAGPTLASASAGAGAPAAVPPTPVAAPTVEPLPVPGVARKLERDKDGALTAAARPKGTLPELVPPTDQHYVVTKNAAADPVVDPNTWRLIVDGEVNQPVQIDYRTLRALPSVEIVKTIECISNFTAMCELTSFGCDLVSTARWKGVRLTDILALAGGLKSSAGALAVISVDEFSAGLPIDVARDPEVIVAYEMNGAVLPREHGHPARLLVPGRYGMKNPKWLAAIRPQPSEHLGWYEQRNWNKDGLVKTMSRIDIPAGGATVTPGPLRVAGIAYGGSRGIKLVELSADGGRTWTATRFIEAPVATDAWVRWEATVQAVASARLELIVRATDGTGEVQTEEFKLPQPDGGSGRHSIEVTVA